MIQRTGIPSNGRTLYVINRPGRISDGGGVKKVSRIDGGVKSSKFVGFEKYAHASSTDIGKRSVAFSENVFIPSYDGAQRGL